MTVRPFESDRRLAQLRDAFDQTFRELPATSSAGTQDLLAIRVAEDPYALRLKELAGVVAARKIVPVPSSRSDLVGLAGVRGKLVPVYSLRALLGYDASPASTPWFALCGTVSTIALALDELEGFLRVPIEDFNVANDLEARASHTGHVVRVGNLTRRVIDIRSAVAAVEAKAGTTGPTKER